MNELTGKEILRAIGAMVVILLLSVFSAWTKESSQQNYNEGYNTASSSLQTTK